MEANLLPVLDLTQEEAEALQPLRATGLSAAVDLRARLPEPFILYPGETIVFATGYKVRLALGTVGMVTSKSGMAAQGIFIPNAPGLIDKDFYPNEIGVILHNASEEQYTIEPNQRIAQFLVSQIVPVMGAANAEEQRTGGFGSTGVA